MKYLAKVSNTTERVLLYLGAIFLAGSVVVIFLEIIFRNLLTGIGAEFMWAEDLAKYLTIWSVFFLIGPMIKIGAHIKVEFVYDRLGPFKKYMSAFFFILCIVVPVLCVIWSIDLMSTLINLRIINYNTPIPPWTWQLALQIGMAFMAFYSLEQLLLLIKLPKSVVKGLKTKVETVAEQS